MGDGHTADPSYMHTRRIDLSAYFARIGYTGSTAPTAETLRALHLAHTTSIPFENLEVLLGKPPKLDLAVIEQKLVAARRGGYCFEQNALFAAVLEQLGFEVTRLSARVRLTNGPRMPRTHMLLLVHADGKPYVADVGFGGCGLLESIPLEAEVNFQQGVWTFRLSREGDWWVLNCPEGPMGASHYAFTLEPHVPEDYEPANHYCATLPESRFLLTLTAQLPSLSQRIMLRNRELLTVTPGAVSTRVLESEEALLSVLADQFGIVMPHGTSFGPTRNAAQPH
jgi:N-hydroxyarylamine O-acetyltransferase